MNEAFATATAVEPIGQHDGRADFAARIHPGWDIGGNANGGYLLALVGRAMSEVTGRPPLTVTGHYLAPAPEGDCTVTVELARAGRRMATASASLHQGGREILRVLGTFAEQMPRDDPNARIAWRDGAPPDLPPYDQCPVPEGTAAEQIPPFAQQLAVRMRPGDNGFRSGEPTGRPELAGWFAFRDEQPIDPIALLLVADAFAPPVFNTDLPAGWVPTIELTVHLRGTPAPGPLACVFRTRFIHGGLLEEDGEIWDTAGQLVAQCRQLALMPRG